uniref:Immunoglobulin C1-set domain-containing protein n=1 Tax=Astatotilapia calliptera TaxID=8154 RepID=A0AAX7VKT0_ASTCA
MFQSILCILVRRTGCNFVTKVNPQGPANPAAVISILCLAEEVELGVENSLIGFVNHFNPPSINFNQTFHQFSTLTFSLSEGDIYSCTVEHWRDPKQESGVNI